ncbi:MAG TPA: glycosyltransferase family 87 protein [Flavobacteriales bacterium]
MSISRRLRPFLVLTGVLLTAALVLEMVNGRFWLSDLKVYYLAAEALRNGTPVYGVAFGEDTGLYKYAPSVLHFFLPYTLLPFPAAALVHYVLMGLALSAIFILLERILQRHVGHGKLPRVVLRAVLGLLCIVVLLVRELHLGNINLGLILLVLLATEAVLAGRSFRAGMLLGIACFVKPYLLLLCIPMVVRVEVRAWLGGLLAFAGALCLPLLYPGPTAWLGLHLNWIASMMGHSLVLESPDTFRYMLINLLGRPLPQQVTLAFILAAAIGLAIWTYRNRRMDDARTLEFDRIAELWIPFALVPNLVVTDQEHFMFSLPMIMLVMAYLFRYRDRVTLLLFVIGLLAYSTRSSDLWGVELENQLVWWGVLGSGNIILLGTGLLAYARWRRDPLLPTEPLSA